ncbi:carboxypeptidase S [Obba rivulosa]|uniref:Carboxypeptidase S n=1 Tax=Obba rivulosa TaxID=1052685 RepID=A0A8E2DLJ9_9APHY|nr:carboxypeptidase S [Obba rivulosa]
MAGWSDEEKGEAAVVNPRRGNGLASYVARFLWASLLCTLISLVVHPWPGLVKLAAGDLLPALHTFVHNSDVCPQVAPLTPSVHLSLLEELEEEYSTEVFQLKAFESLGGAVRIPTIAYDDLLPPGKDPRWEIFDDLHTYLEKRFPLVHSHLAKTPVNTYALVYHWQGTDGSLKPMLLTAHQDVVPVEPLTMDDWVHPPFSGYYDGEWIWGRGSCDDKPGLIGSLTTVEMLLEKGFQPRRTIVLAYGIDEERGGISGATAIRDYLLRTYGEYAFSMLVDEGGGYSVSDDVIMASPGVAEKGKFDVRMDITTPGGHSSIPPPHTSIGMLAAVIKQLEAHPHPSHLRRESTYYQSLQCQAEHDPSLPGPIRDLVMKSAKSDKALSKLEVEMARKDRMFAPMCGTTQAVDIVHGGVKSNALPELAWLIVNHRLDAFSSIVELKDRITRTINPVATRFNLSVDAFGTLFGAVKPEDAYGQLRLFDAFGTALEPAPVTPMAGSGPWELLSGTIIGAVESSNRTAYSGKKAFIAPGMSTGRYISHTKHYWKLTKHIFRYGHMNHGDSYNGAHTVNEAVRAEGFLEVIRFFTRLILNGDESSLLN